MDTFVCQEHYCNRTLIRNTVMASKCEELWMEIPKQVIITEIMNGTFDTHKTRNRDCEELIKDISSIW